MARILVVSLPFAGHVGPMVAVAGELVRRGHEVVAYTGAKYGGRFTAVGATWLPWQEATDFDDARVAATFPRVGDGKGLRSAQANLKDVLFGTAPGQAADILAEARERPFDLLVTDQLAFGGALAGEVLSAGGAGSAGPPKRPGPPWVSVAVTSLMITSRTLPPPGVRVPPAAGRLGRARDVVLRGVFRLMYRVALDPQINGARTAVGLPSAPPAGMFDSLYSPHLVLAQGVPGLDYPRGDLAPHVHYVGRLAAGAPTGTAAALPSWWPDVAAARAAGRPVVHVTQGTLDVGPDDLLKPAIAGLADEPVLVVCSTGGVPLSTLGPLPPHVRAAEFLPHDLLLPSVDVMVTNGGWGGVLAAVRAGVPLVVAGESLDKPEVARRVAWSGAGIDLRTGRPDPQRVRRAVRQVLDEPRYRQRVEELAAAMTASGGTARAGDLIDGVLAAARR